MLSEQEMYDRILGYAEEHDDIRAVILNGSRANPNRIKDVFNDFDIVYLVRDVAYYKNLAIDREYGEKLFGPMLVFQRTDENELFHEQYPEFVAYLMQFADGNRIDLTIAGAENYAPYCFDDRLSVVLLDKDGTLPLLPPPNVSTHYIRKAEQNLFTECRVEFWWVAPYVAKGLWRGQILYAHRHLDVIRDMLRQMLAWRVAAEHGFEMTLGKNDYKLQTYLPAPLWEEYLTTFALPEENAVWQALFNAARMFTQVTKDVEEAFGFTVGDEYDRRVTAFLRYIRTLPRTATDMEGEITC